MNTAPMQLTQQAVSTYRIPHSARIRVLTVNPVHMNQKSLKSSMLNFHVLDRRCCEKLSSPCHKDLEHVVLRMPLSCIYSQGRAMLHHESWTLNARHPVRA
jgi:hypothetical protein